MDRFVEGNHRAAYNATVGIDFKVRRLDINDKAVKLQIWDTAGQEKFNAITTAYYRQDTDIKTDDCNYSCNYKILTEVSC